MAALLQQAQPTAEQKLVSGSLWRRVGCHFCPLPWGRGSSLMITHTVWLLPAQGCPPPPILLHLEVIHGHFNPKMCSLFSPLLASWPLPPSLLWRALLQADVILLLGARLNWILHFGLPPRFDPNVKIIQVYRLKTPSLKHYCLYQIYLTDVSHRNKLIVSCVQVDLCAEEMGNNVRPAVALLGDINAVVTQVTVDQLISSIATTVLSASVM